MNPRWASATITSSTNGAIQRSPSFRFSLRIQVPGRNPLLKYSCINTLIVQPHKLPLISLQLESTAAQFDPHASTNSPRKNFADGHPTLRKHRCHPADGPSLSIPISAPDANYSYSDIDGTRTTPPRPTRGDAREFLKTGSSAAGDRNRDCHRPNLARGNDPAATAARMTIRPDAADAHRSTDAATRRGPSSLARDGADYLIARASIHESCSNFANPLPAAAERPRQDFASPSAQESRARLVLSTCSARCFS